MPSQGCSEKAPDFSTFYHAGVHLRKVEARFLIQITGGSSVLGRRTLRYHDTTLFFHLWLFFSTSSSISKHGLPAQDAAQLDGQRWNYHFLFSPFGDTAGPGRLFFAFMALHDREAGEFKIQGGSARKEGADEKERLAIAGDGVYWNCCLEPTVTWLAGNGKGAKKNENWSAK